MKYIPFIFVCALCACSAEPAENMSPPVHNVTSEKPAPQTDISVDYQSGNQKDYNGLKQGYWIKYGHDDPARGYPSEAKIEEGDYQDDQKNGPWIYYNVKSEIDSTVTYENGVTIKSVH